MLLLSGKDDPLVPADQPPYFAALLGEAGADVTLEFLPAGHALTQQDICSLPTPGWKNFSAGQV